MSDSDFKIKSCSACNGFTEKIGKDDALCYLKGLPEWALSEDGISIYRKFNFKNFKWVSNNYMLNYYNFMTSRRKYEKYF